MNETTSPLEQVRSAAGVRHSIAVQKLFTTKSNAIEKDVKARVKQIIKTLAPGSHVFMPVQTGLGSPDLDFVVDINGFSLRIETKVDGKQPSARQKLTIAELDKAGTPVLVIDQNNLVDVAIVADFLITGKQSAAYCYAQAQRAEYIR